MCSRRFRTQWRNINRWVVSSKGGVNAVSERGHGWVGLNLDGAAEGSVPDCEVPDA